MHSHFRRLARIAPVALCLAFSAMPAHARCALDTQSATTLAQWKASGFATVDADERKQHALDLIECLDASDPLLRDGIAFEALSTWMRAKQLETGTLGVLGQRLLRQLEGTDAPGFRKPFAALVLSEVARTDRVQPWMTAGERERMVVAASGYLSSVRDYRGYVDGDGWRHGVAHGADWVLQLALNKAVEPKQVLSLLAAVGSQVMPAGRHVYAFGEPGRLARAVAYAVARGDLDQAAVDAWLTGLVESLGTRPDGAEQAEWWTRRANLENFLHAVAYLVDNDPSPALVALASSVRATMQRLP